MLDERYYMYRTAYHLLTKKQYDVLYMDGEREEVWMEKSADGTSNIIRLSLKGFGWKNQLMKDMEETAGQMIQMKRTFPGKHVKIHHVYISTYSPVDDWEEMNRPVMLKGRRRLLDMFAYNINPAGGGEEESRLQRAIGVKSISDDEPFSLREKESRSQFYLHFLMKELDRNRRKVDELFSYGTPIFTYLLLLLNISCFLVVEFYGDSTSINDLIKYGAKYNPAVIDGEWWRILTSMFLHIGFLHLFMNMLAMYYIGSLTERIYGNSRFLAIYMLAGIGGGLASFAFTVNVSAGASGALFGLFGALLFFGVPHKKVFFQTIGMNIVILVGINIVFGLAVPQIDNGAHMGGLIAGFIAAAIVYLPKERKMLIQVLAMSTYLFMAVGLGIYGTEHNLESQSYHLLKLEEALAANDYETVIEAATNALELDGELDHLLLFQRSYAYMEKGKIDLAKKDLEESIEAEEPVPEAFYNLALIYVKEGRMEEAEKLAEEAYDQRPENEDFAKLYNRLTGDRDEE
ncbi:rhomboid family intramembrane serine protease [Virgibacillus xinjiangensis]|uniref:Rhomboid family intramembrane serine protease n=1 Tax=Virgibacillus xinjiangensis TaxID=393090 RepID=A0ABV7CRM2_9BACI